MSPEELAERLHTVGHEYADALSQADSLVARGRSMLGREDEVVLFGVLAELMEAGHFGPVAHLAAALVLREAKQQAVDEP
ncbi:hypothetical protein ACIBTV_25580 [Micromonospora sp. NPDC049366]|uniref:hypothetical protein n=1 Tax=Micromonospora sp. NPDC049366 TaxID=3364271 RepID=UPI0037A5E2B5